MTCNFLGGKRFFPIVFFIALNAPASAQTLSLPPRPADAPGASAILRKIATLPLAERESEVCAQALAGNVPEFLRVLKPVSITNASAGVATFYVAPDYLAIGSSEDYFLAPLSPSSAQRIADALDCSLPTRKMVDAIYAAAEVKLAPVPLAPGPGMITIPDFSNHNYLVWQQRKAELSAHPLGALVAGDQKDVVITPRLENAAGKVAIYGWHHTRGVPIQPLYLGHSATWVDYSQCIRLVSRRVIVNGTAMDIESVLRDPKLAPLLSDEGVISVARYPTNPVSTGAEGSASIHTAHITLPPVITWTTNSHWNERSAAFHLTPEINVVVNTPADQDSSKPLALLFYALPNGNTIRQAFGKHVAAGDDWHFDTQQIGAQTRFLRGMLTNKEIAVAYLENDLKSWPSWRRKYGNDALPGLLGSVAGLFETNRMEIALTSHSGGGSLIFGFLEAVPEIPSNISRLAFLDSDYAYARERGHLEKLVHWLQSGGSSHYLCVLAYDDASARLNGKPFVSAAGGTWGRSHALMHDLAESFEFTSRTNGSLETYTALGGRIEFDLLENPERKIFHTVQVEKNGFIHCILSGTDFENRGYQYFGDRAYRRFVGRE